MAVSRSTLFDSGLPSWLVEVAGAGEAASVSGGILSLDSTTNGLIVYDDQKLATDENWTLEIVCRWVTGSPLRWPIHIVEDAAAAPSIWSGFTDAGSLVRISAANTADMEILYWDDADARIEWNGAGESWSTGFAGVNFEADSWYRFVIQNDGANERFRVLLIGGEQPATEANHGELIGVFTDWLPWTTTRLDATSSDLWVVLGVPGTGAAGNVEFESYRIIAGGPTHYGTVDYREASGGYLVYQLVAFGGLDQGEFPLYTLAARDASPLIATVGATWESDGTRHCTGPRLGPDSNYYMAYVGVDGSGNFQIGVGLTNAQASSITKSGDNPVIPTGDAGEPANTPDVFVAPEMKYDDDTGQWEMLAAEYDGSTFAIHRWTNPDDDPRTGASWTYEGEIISAGSGYLAEGPSSPRLFRYGTDYLVFIGARDATDPPWNFSLFRGASLDALSAISSPPLLSGGQGPSTTLTAGATDTDTVTVADTTDFEPEMYCTISADNTQTNWLNARVAQVVSGTSLRLYSRVTLSSGARIVPLSNMSIDSRGIIDLGAGASPRWVAALTMFGPFGQYSGDSINGEGEWSGWATADDPEGPWTIQHLHSPPAPPMGAPTGALGVARSYENLAFVQGRLPAVLAVADAAMASTWDAPTLSVTTQLVVADSALASTFDAPALTQAHQLVVAGAALASTWDGPALTQAHVLAADDAALASSWDVPALTQAHVLAVLGALLGSSWDAPVLTQANVLAVDDSALASTWDSPTLSLANALVVADALMASLFDAPALTQAHALVVADAALGSAWDAPTLSLSTLLSVADAVLGSSWEAPALTQAHLLAVADALLLSTWDAPTLTQAQSLTVADAALTSSWDAVAWTTYGRVLEATLTALTVHHRTLTIKASDTATI